MNNDNRYAPPSAEVADTPEVVAAGELAGRGSRFLASLIDGLLAGGLSVGAGLLLGLNIWKQTDLSVLQMASVYLLAFLGVCVFQGWPLYRRGQTLGKMALRIRIARADGSPAGVGRTLGVRIGLFWALGLIPVIGALISLVDALLIFRESRRCLHDLVADTVVVKA